MSALSTAPYAGYNMTVLHTLRKRTPGPAAGFQAFLDHLADHPDDDPYRILFPTPPPNARD